MIENEQVLSLLQGKNTLRDSELTTLSVSTSFGLPNLRLEFSAREGSDFKRVVVHFVEIVEFEMAYEEGNSFLDVWDLKFIHLEDGSFYLSLDPDAKTLESAGCLKLEPSKDDGFFVRAKRVKLETFDHHVQ